MGLCFKISVTHNHNTFYQISIFKPLILLSLIELPRKNIDHAYLILIN